MDTGRSADGRGGSAAGRIAREVAAQQAALLARLREEAVDGEAFAEAARRLAEDFGAVTATALDALTGAAPSAGAAARPPAARDAAAGEAAAGSDGGAVGDSAAEGAGADDSQEDARAEEAAARGELPSLYRPGHMRRRLEQLLEINRRYGHPFGLAVFDASGPGTRDGADGGPEAVLSILGTALRDSIRIVDEAFLLEEDAICVLAPNLRTVEGMQMAERLLGQLDELERVGGLRISVAAGVVACPDHGTDAEQLLHKADAALWRARAVGQPVGVGELAH